jgi:Flp pilus assembly protein TadG
MLRSIFRRRGDRDRGQALVEFALILPVFMLIFLGILQFGFLLSGHIGLINSVREAARYGSTSPTSDNPTAASNGANICTQIASNLQAGIAGYNPANLDKSAPDPRTRVLYTSYTDPHGAPLTYSVRLTVQVQYRHPLLVPLVGVIIDGLDGASDGFLSLGASEVMRVENPALTTDPAVNTTVNCL